jgi:hypothetical protein
MACADECDERSMMRGATGDVAQHPLWDKSGHPIIHSITLSARASKFAGTARPSAFEVLRLMTSSNTWWVAGPEGQRVLRHGESDRDTATVGVNGCARTAE